MADSYTIESILAADCGATTTRVLLLDVVDDQYRFVAQGESPTTVAPPHNDIVVGVIQAIRQLESIVGRRLLGDDEKLIRPERSDGSGVDAFVATVSAAAPLRVVVAGLIPELSVASALRAIAQVPARVEGTIFLGEGSDPTAQIDLIRRVRPDVVVMVGGTEGGATNALGALADVVTMAGKLLERERRPELVFAGNVGARSMLADKASGLLDFYPVDNIRPTLNTEQPGPLVEELETLYGEHKMARLPGFGRLSAWSPVSVTPGSKAFGQSIRFVSEQYGLNVLGVNLGSSQTLLASAVDKNYTLAVGTGWGVGQGARQVFSDAAPGDVSRWILQEDAAVTDGIDAALTKALYPRAPATTLLELQAEQALAREALRMTKERAMPIWPTGTYRPYAELPPLWDLILLAGGYLTHQPNFGQAALMVLDALQPIGVCTLAADVLGLTEVFGAIGAVQPVAATQILERDGIVTLGSLVCPVGTAKEGEPVLRAKLTYPSKQVLNLEVTYGSIEVIPLPAGQKATLELRPSRQFDIGWGRSGRGAVAEVDGGALGVIIDARGRPLQVPQDEEVRRRLLQEWRWNIGY